MRGRFAIGADVPDSPSFISDILQEPASCSGRRAGARFAVGADVPDSPSFINILQEAALCRKRRATCKLRHNVTAS